jgi:hypothetical protein
MKPIEKSKTFVATNNDSLYHPSVDCYRRNNEEEAYKGLRSL